MIGSDDVRWMDDAACKGSTSLFYPEQRGHDAVRVTQQAKRVCAGCPVRLACLDHALDHGEVLGVWGGLGPRERRGLRKRRRAA